MQKQTRIARRQVLQGSAALTAAMALQGWRPGRAQDASPTPEPEEVTVTTPVEGKLNVTWWTHNNTAFVDANTMMIERFHAANPDVNIVYQYFPYEIFISKLQAGYNAGNVADIQQMFGTWVTQYAGFGLLDPVPAAMAEGYAERFYPAASGAYGLNGQFYGMPKEFNLENGGLFLNPALLTEAGVAEPPTTWQALVDAAVAATQYDDQGRITKAGFQFTDNDSITFLFLQNILQQGATYWADDGVHVNLQTDAAQQAWQDQVDLVVTHHVDDETSYTGDRYLWFFQGNGAMLMRGPWVIPVGEEQFPGLEFDYVPLPPYAGEEPLFAAESGWGEVVNAAAPAENKEAAWRFVDFMAQPDNLRDWNLATYTIPALTALQNDPAILEAAPLLQTAFDALPFGQWVGPVQNRDRFWQAIHDNFTAVCLGQVDAPTGLVQAEQQINAMIDETVGP
ncbi:MAG: extracellular solute-binding protein [Chloroflexia bacterium]|nr:extracellular solute-binding protein [Chloroflexia bacterium]